MDENLIKKFIQHHTPLNLNTIKLFNSIEIEDASEITRRITDYAVSRFLNFKHLSSNKFDKEEIILDIPMSDESMLLELNKVNLEFSISEFLKRMEGQTYLSEKYQKNNDDKINYLERCITEILKWYDETGYSYPISTSDYFVRSKNVKKKKIKNQGGRPVDSDTKIQKDKLNKRYHNLMKTNNRIQSLKILNQEFPQWARSTIQTYLKK